VDSAVGINSVERFCGDEALEEGITMRWLSTVAHADEGKLLIEKMKLDDSGFPQPTGEFVRGDLLRQRGRGRARPDDRAPGDLRRRGHGARRADGHRGHRPWQEGGPQHRRVPARRPLHPVGPASARQGRAAQRLVLCRRAPATVRPRLEAARRITTFDEVVGGLDESNALFEARRCMSCGNCFGCDNCYGVCPDHAARELMITKTSQSQQTVKSS